MNKMRDTEFPPWLIQNFIINIYNRQRLKPETVPKQDNGRNRTWGKACSRAVNKLKDRFRIYLEKQTLKSDWQNLISYQIAKLNKRYDPIYLWGICEYRLLEHMNSFDFGNGYIKTSLFNFRAGELVGDLNKRIRSQRSKLKRLETCIWTDLIGNTYKRFTKPEKEAGLELGWNLCYRYNGVKLSKISGYQDWHSCISQNQKKVQKWIQPRLGLDAEN